MLVKQKMPTEHIQHPNHHAPSTAPSPESDPASRPAFVEQASLFNQPLHNATPAEILAHFQSRRDVRYFALRDEEQASQPQIQDVLQNRFTYNDETHDLPSNFDWTSNPSADIEWHILLHKCYFAPGLGEEYIQTGDPRYLQKWVDLTESWIDTVALDFLPCDVMGRRVQNWIFAHFYFTSRKHNAIPEGSEQSAAISEAFLTPLFYLKFLSSLHAQVNYLCENLTPKRNHRTIELYAIFMAAVVFPEFRDAARWLDFSRAELVKNIQDDLRPDGIHCEQSTDYHHLVVKNYLGVKRLANENGIDLPAIFDDRLQSALDFAAFAHKPDGNIPSLSDGDARSFLDLLHQGFALYRNPEWLYVATQGRSGLMPSQRSRLFPHGGYTILRSGWGSGRTAYTDEQYLIFDCGPLGEGNHGHLDLLHFELAAFGQSLVVDPGRYTYHEPHPDVCSESGEENWRVRFRGTSYHNTVQVNGKEQTRYIFHKRKFKIRGPEPEWKLHDFCTSADFDFVHGEARSHEYDVIHERIIFFVNAQYWIITDILRANHTFESENLEGKNIESHNLDGKPSTSADLETSKTHQYDLHFHLSDSVQDRIFCKEGISATFVDGPNLRIAQPLVAGTVTTVEEGFVSPTYGIKHAAPIVRTTRHTAETVFHTVLYPHQSHAPAMDLKVLPVKRESGPEREDGLVSRDGTEGEACPSVEATALRISIAHHGQSWTDTFLYANTRNAPMPDAETSNTETPTIETPTITAHHGAEGHAPTFAADNIVYTGSPVVVRRQHRSQPRLFGRSGAVQSIDGEPIANSSRPQAAERSSLDEERVVPPIESKVAS